MSTSRAVPHFVQVRPGVVRGPRYAPLDPLGVYTVFIGRKAGASNVNQRRGHHAKAPQMPPEMVEQAAQKMKAGEVDQFGVKGINAFFTDKGVCLIDRWGS